MKTIAIMISLLTGMHIFSQTITYDDVAVIINDNSPTSVQIGNYFQSARNIPAQNMIHILAPTTEDIDSLQFEQMRVQIEAHLVGWDMVDSIAYLVTTKGIPLTVNRGCVVDTISGASCASVDSELALILGAYNNAIGVNGQIMNPFYEATDNFDRDAYGIYLVTRLDGYSKEDVFHLIDHSAPLMGVNKASAKGVVDISNATGGDSIYFTDQFVPAYNYLINNSWNADLDLATSPWINQNNVFGYFGLGHGPLPSMTLNYEWTDGAVGAMSMCNSAFTFDAGTNSNTSFLIADLIADGCTGALGHVDYIYFSQIWDADVFVDRYLDPNQTFNLAESFYMSEKTLSWQTVIIGDPKASLVIDNLAELNAPEINGFQIYPNPSAGNFTVNASEAITSILVFDMRGAVVKRYDKVMQSTVALDLSDVGSAVYLLQVEIDGDLLKERVVVQR